MVKGYNALRESSEYLYNGLGALVTNTWVITKNGYGYHDVNALAETLQVLNPEVVQEQMELSSLDELEGALDIPYYGEKPAVDLEESAQMAAELAAEMAGSDAEPPAEVEEDSAEPDTAESEEPTQAEISVPNPEDSTGLESSDPPTQNSDVDPANGEDPDAALLPQADLSETTAEANAETELPAHCE